MNRTTPEQDIWHPVTGWQDSPQPQPGGELPPWEVAARWVPVPLDTLRRVKTALERHPPASVQPPCDEQQCAP